MKAHKQDHINSLTCSQLAHNREGGNGRASEGFLSRCMQLRKSNALGLSQGGQNGLFHLKVFPAVAIAHDLCSKKLVTCKLLEL